MQTLTEALLSGGLAGRVLSERQVDRLVGGDPARRYGLINRALKSDELIRIRRGLYVLPDRYGKPLPHPFVIAQAIEPGSYVSLETSLSFHGWIPEAVHVTASVVPGRKSLTLDHEKLGSFTFHPLALRKQHFLELIERQKFGDQTAWIARPLRALMDLVALRKVEWQGLAWLTEGLRIDLQALRKVPKTQFDTLSEVYQHKRPRSFLHSLMKELKRD
jgi:hypothetical protein